LRLMVIPSKANLLKWAQPLDRMRVNTSIRTLVVDRAEKAQFEKAVRERRIPFCDKVGFEFTDHPTGVLIALDASGQFCGSYSLSGASSKVLPQTTGDAPAGAEVAPHLHELAMIAFAILLSTWIVVRGIALSINQ
jgi:hypothetical protein